MKKLLLFCLFALSLSQAGAQITFTAPVAYTTGVPTGAPSGQGSRLRLDLLTGWLYEWSPVASSWLKMGQGIDQTSGSIAPAYAPGIGQSWFAVNGSNNLYHYSGSGTSWDCLNCSAGSVSSVNGLTGTVLLDLSLTGTTLSITGDASTVSFAGWDTNASNDFSGSWNDLTSVPAGFADGTDDGTTYTAGAGISINGSNVITNTGDTDGSDDLTTSSTAGGDLSGLFSNLQIGSGTVGTTEIATDGVDAAEIAANAVGASELVSTAVTAGTYGSATQVAQATFDADGRATSASNVTIAIPSTAVTDFTEAAQDVTGAMVNGGTGISATYSDPSGTLTITNTAPDQTVSITGAGINAVTGTYPNFTVTGNEVDGSVSNEGALGVGAGSGTSSTLTTNTSGGNAVTINAAGILTISESTSSNGGSITLTGTEVDGSTTNELQNLSLTGQALGISSGSGVTLPIVGVSAGTGISVSTSSGTATVTNTGDTNAADDITISTTAGGDLSGTYPNPTVDGLQGVSVSATSPSSGQVLKYNGSAWAPGTDDTGGGGGGGGVATVTGDAVDNTDPANPVVNAIPYIFPDEMFATGSNGFLGGHFECGLSNFNTTYTEPFNSFPFYGLYAHDTGNDYTFMLGFTEDGGSTFFNLEASAGSQKLNTNFSPFGFNVIAIDGSDYGAFDFGTNSGFTVSKNGYSIFTANSNASSFFAPAKIVNLTASQRDAWPGTPQVGWTIFCTDCTANDSSTGVNQTYNGSTWKNQW